MKRENGITLITLTVTVIVLIILASITIGVLNRNDGLINRTKESKETTEISSEKEILTISSTNAIDKDVYGNITEKNLQTALNSNIGKDKTIVYDEEENFVVKFIFNYIP